MLCHEVGEITFTGEQLARDYLTTRYLREEPGDCLFYWCSTVDVKPRIYLALGLVSVLPTDVKEIVSQDTHMNFVFSFLDRYKFFGTTLKLLILYELKGVLDSFGCVTELSGTRVIVKDKTVNFAIHGYYPDRTFIALGVSLPMLVELDVNPLLFRREFLQRVAGLLATINKQEMFTVLES